MFAEMDSGDGRGDGGEGTADFDGSFGFGIEGIDVAGAAIEPDEDTGFGAG
jgi:hypothetical protein